MKNNVVGALGLILLFPIVMAALSYISALRMVIETLMLSPVDPKILAGTISAQIVHQLKVLMVLIPGVAVCSVSIFKLKFNPEWHSISLKVYGIVSMLMFPILSFAGIYLLFLSRKQWK